MGPFARLSDLTNTGKQKRDGSEKPEQDAGKSRIAGAGRPGEGGFNHVQHAKLAKLMNAGGGGLREDFQMWFTACNVRQRTDQQAPS